MYFAVWLSTRPKLLARLVISMPMRPTLAIPLPIVLKLTSVDDIDVFMLSTSAVMLLDIVAASALMPSNTGLALSIASTVAVTTPTLLLKR
jgi:hypothetical protein